MELIILPIATGLVAAFSGKYSRWIALASAVLSMVLLGIKLQGFHADGTFQYVFNKPWFSGAIHFKTGIDGISMVLLLLTNLMVPVILLGAFGEKFRENATMFALILVMQGALNGVFMAMDGIMFYIFWELALLPIYFICAIWGENNTFKTTLKFFIYTFIGSLAMLASFIYLFNKVPDHASFDLAALMQVTLSPAEAIWVGAGILLAFAVKIPLLPLHSWQADTYTEAPTGGSMLLSGIMLKMGLYGLIRWFFPLVPEAIDFYVPIIIGAGIVGVVYGALIAIRQKDMKRIIAYSSLSHVGLIAAGIATLTIEGIQGAVVQMFSHGVNVIGLFLAVEVIQSRAGTRNIMELGGIAKQAPVFSVFFLLVLLGATAVPFTNGFPGELLLLKSVFTYHAVWGVFAGLTIIFCAVYMLRMYQFSMLGHEKNGIYLFPDLKWNEWVAFAIVGFLVVFVGFNPQWILDISATSVNHTLQAIGNTVGGIR